MNGTDPNTVQEKYYCFAGIELAVCIPRPWMYTQEGTLEPFQVEAVQAPSRFSFQKVEVLDPPQGELTAQLPGLRVYAQGEKLIRYLGEVDHSWEKGYLRSCQQGKEYSVQVRTPFSGPISAKTVLQILGTEHLLAQSGSFVLHSAFVDRGGEAILFTAPSGTGKSTQAELWKACRGARIINGDRAAVRVTEKGIFAAGLPYAGSSPYCLNETLPLGAIVYLAQGAENTLRRLRGYEAFARIWEGVSVNTWRQDDMARVSDAVQQVCQSIPVYFLTCTPSEGAVEVLEQAMENGRNLSGGF